MLNSFSFLTDEINECFLVDEYQYMNKDKLRQLIFDIQDVLPENLISEFEGIEHIKEMLQWREGDLTNLIWEHVQAAKLPYKFTDVCYFVSVRFLNRTRSYNTVKAWALTARRFPPPVREKYNYEDIPFAHFAYAGKRKFDQVGPDGKRTWQNILEYSYDGKDQQGYDVSVVQLEEAFEGKVRVVPGYEIGSDDTRPEPAVQLESTSLEVEFAAALHALTTLAERLSGNPKVLELIKQGLSLLRVALEQLSQEEKS